MDNRFRSYYHMGPWDANRKMGVGKVCYDLATIMVEFRNKKNIHQLAERDKRAISISAMWAEMKGVVDIDKIPWYALPCDDAIKTQEQYFQQEFPVI